jgi:hypothetical protein
MPEQLLARAIALAQGVQSTKLLIPTIHTGQMSRPNTCGQHKPLA